MSFQQILAGEKAMIGFPISGHPLDGLKSYCERRSNNTKKLKMTFEELAKLPEYQVIEVTVPETNSAKPPEKKEQKREVAQAVGVISFIRKIVTKTGKTMMFLVCEGYDFDFEVVLFSKDVEKYAAILEEDLIIIVSGNLTINLEYNRKSIQ
jgi:DNA polymerase-3 subunit alpha